MLFSDKIKELRAEAKYSQKEVAENIGITHRAYQRYEELNAHPRNRDVLKRLADLYNVTIDWLLDEEDRFLQEAEKRYGVKGKQQGKKLLNDMQAYLAGGGLSEEDRDAFLQSVMRMYFKTKEIAKEKYGTGGNSISPSGK